LSERSPKALLESFGLRPKRHFGQNFLADHKLAARIAGLVPEGAGVIELGAGLGALTWPLIERAGRTIAVERDRDLVPALASLFAAEIQAGKLRIEEADAKTVDLYALTRELPRPYVLTGNLPYQISGPLLERAVEHAQHFAKVVFLLQLEVAERLGAAPNSEHYGALSVFVQAAFDAERALVIRRGAFYPQPDVDSAVVVLTPRAAPVAETESFRTLVRAAFGQRRKKLRNAWAKALGLEPAALQAVALRAKIDLDVRGETLGVADFARMASELSP
jgi:16S rRNA (adenine1518-N6/adenine1519-N6)-dimethyltransferase